jgi:hypothetical protein
MNATTSAPPDRIGTKHTLPRRRVPGMSAAKNVHAVAGGNLR